jgi:predicted NBD/HSP70 family sugar kinase
MLGVKTAALPASLRRTNQRTVLSLLLRLGRASRADLAKAAGISQPTAGKITAELLELGLIQKAGLSAPKKAGKAGRKVPRLGRPGHLLQLDSHQPRFIAIELGVSQTHLSALPVGVSLEDAWTYRFATHESSAAWLKELTNRSSSLPQQGLWGVLVSVPGIVDELSDKVVFSPNLHWLEKVNLPQLLRQVWDLPVLLVQEIRALALGHLTAEPAGEDFLLVDFGQGVGGAIVLDGKLYSQPMPLSGELGHTPVPGNPRRCGCGAIGCLETLVSQSGLLESFAAARQGNGPLTWKELTRYVSERGVEPWLAGTLSATAQVIAGALNVLGLHHVVITGVLNDLPTVVVDFLSNELRKGALWARFGEVACQRASHRRAAGLVTAGLDRLVLPAGDGGGLLSRETKNHQNSRQAWKPWRQGAVSSQLHPQISRLEASINPSNQ